MTFARVAVAEAGGAILAHTTRAGDRVLKKGHLLDGTDLAALAAAGITEVTCVRLATDELAEDAAAAAIAAALAGRGVAVDPAHTGRANLRATANGLFVVDAAAIARANSIDEAITVATIPADSPVRAGAMIATVKIIPFGVRADLVAEACRTCAVSGDGVQAGADAQTGGDDVPAGADDAQTGADDMQTGVRGDHARPEVDRANTHAGSDDLRTGAATILSGARRPLAVIAWQPRRVGLVLTRFASTAESILDRAAAAQRARIARLGSELVQELRVAHDVEAVATAIATLANAGCDPILALGASAIVDRADVIPAAIERAGGAIARFGMPVDPGNLSLLGSLAGATVIGMPGCARSPARSGFDWILERTCAGLAIDPREIGALGVGGLLEEAPRPAPREGRAPDKPDKPSAAPGVAAIVLAAGRSSRMGGNKLVAELAGKPLVRHAVEAALASPARPVIVVTGNEAERIHAALAGLDVTLVHNAAFASGMASSLRAGIAALSDAATGALICLGDMPRVAAHQLAALIDAFTAAHDDGAIIVPTYERKRGNPVLLGRRRFAELATLEGDIGARTLIERHAVAVHFVALDDPAILVDADTPEALARLEEPG